MNHEQIGDFLESHNIHLRTEELLVIKMLLVKQRQDTDYRIWEFREQRSGKFTSSYAAMNALMKELMKPRTVGDLKKRPYIIAYIAHPIGGSVKENLADLCRIVRRINLEQPDVVPFVPYYADCMSMDDNNPIERARGIVNDRTILQAGLVDELWLTGDRVSEGMEKERELAERLGIKVMNFINEL